MDRMIRLSTVRNGRDLGGLVNRHGRALRTKQLLRAANLSGTAEADLLALRDRWRLALVLDLRTSSERRKSPDALAPGVEYAALPVFEDRVAGVTHEKDSEAERVPMVADMSRIYRHMVLDDDIRPRLALAARRVMEHDFSRGSVLWHCAEGKDRTGLLAAVLLLALEVDRAAILEDYALTNLVNRARSEQFYRELLARGRSEAEAAMVREATLAKPEYLQAALDAMDERCGSADAYLREALGLEDALIGRFRAAVLE